jgi:hypothetical protein
MTLQTFPGVDTFPTHHCITGSLRRVYEAHGYPVSEEFLLGLGSGVGFSYWHFKGTDPFYGGRANFERPGEDGLEKTVARRTGVILESHRTTSRRKAEAGLLEMLDAQEPVMVYLDMGLLPYFDLPPDYHFGAHTVAVVGYDASVGTVLVADRDEQTHVLTLDELEAARGSTFKPFPPRHQWYTVDFAEARPPRPEEVWEAIGDVTTGMLEPPIANVGVKGIRTAAERTLRWPEVMDDAALRRTCVNVAIFIDPTGGTGGGIFRYMYSRFLEEAGGVTGDDRLGKLGAGFVDAGDQWERVAKALRGAAEAPDAAAALPDAVALLPEIADAEQALWEELAALVP